MGLGVPIVNAPMGGAAGGRLAAAVSRAGGLGMVGTGSSATAAVLGRELADVARAELDKLPQRQRQVVTMRDMLGFESSEVCELLDISAANQRVLLHRGRAAVRQALEAYLAERP